MRRLLCFIAGFVSVILGVTHNLSAQTPVWTQFPGTPLNNTLRHDDVVFIGQTNGWSARGIDGIYRTTNGGLNWTRMTSLNGPIPHFRAIGFASLTRGWAGNLGPGSYDGNVTDTNLLYETFDGGETWSVVPSINATDMKGFCAMHVLDAQHVYGVGRVRGPAHFTKTEDGGNSWWTTNLTAGGVMGGLMDVYFKDSQTGFILGMDTNQFSAPPYYGSIARTTNGGLSWQVLVTTTVANSYFWKMTWPSPDVGYASLQQNSAYDKVIFYKTTDGGSTWVSNGIPLSAIGSPSSFGVQGIGFVSETEGWMGGSTVLNPPYTFIHTVDGGVTWTPEGYSNTRSINRIRFASPTLGYMSGQTLHVYHIPLSVSVAPTNPTVALNDPVTFTADAYGTEPLHYQWRSHGTNLPGATASSFSIAHAQAEAIGDYEVIVSDFSGSITSATTLLTVTGVPLPPTITTQPLSQVVNPGDNATFTVGAAGSPPLTYQWRFNGSNLDGATNATFTRTNAQAAHVGIYSVVVANDLGHVTSATARLALGFVDDFEAYDTLIEVTSPAITNGYKIVYRSAASGFDFQAIFGFDYSSVAFPTEIPPAPHSANGTTKGLFLTVNKDATPGAAAVNLYPVGQHFSGDYSFKFDLWINWFDPATSTEHALFGINHSGNVTNRVGQAPSDGLFFAVEGENDSSATSTTLRDYSVFRGGGAGAPILMTADNTDFGPAPLLGPRFDSADPGFVALFPAKIIPGLEATPAGTAGLGWIRGEVRQINNHITWLLNDTIVAQYTNTYDYTEGNILIGYNDHFNSVGDFNNFAIFDNIRVANLIVEPAEIVSPHLVGNEFHFRFTTEADASYTVEWTADLTSPTWVTQTNLLGTGAPVEIAVPLETNESRYFRVRRP
ncbi:MAG: immunoglobulin domain-containing protein [Verrucomicrobiae bacterium]|nr:immunoglobulin domain-containing protein [Verrucomicrobiae bacterium]